MKTASAILQTVALPKGPYPTPDPFLFCVYHNDAYPPAHDNTMEAPRRGNGHDFDSNLPYRMYHGSRIPGFPQHPHRGFETITATIDGLIDHSDSVGNGGRYGMGDLQWMTAGKGVVHGEMFPLIHKDKPNNLRFFQIWLNLPKKNKMVEPNFAMFWDNDVPRYKTKDELASVTVWFGDYFLDEDDTTVQSEITEEQQIQRRRRKNPNEAPEHSWAKDPMNDVAVLHIIIQPGGKLTLPPAHGSSEINRALYLVEGFDGAIVNNELKCKEQVMIKVDASKSIDLMLPSNAKAPSEFLLLQGRPISEPVAQHGPFVMNTQAEIRQAFLDYHKTQFGGWPWERDDMVFPREKGRFALLYGKETTPNDSPKYETPGHNAYEDEKCE